MPAAPNELARGDAGLRQGGPIVGLRSSHSGDGHGGLRFAHAARHFAHFIISYAPGNTTAATILRVTKRCGGTSGNANPVETACKIAFANPSAAKPRARQGPASLARLTGVSFA
jgi:hypothetical protein